MRYCIWNNKGGVGKTFLTYCMATEYALKHPNKAVAVVDMCPQANISEMLLGGNGIGETNLTKFYSNRRTIASYIMDRHKQGWSSKLGTEIDYFVQVNAFNQNLPKNLYLLPGDFDLDGCAEIIDYIAADPRSRGAWASSRKFLSDIIPLFEEQHKKDTAVFIDTNPSFANYTQAALIASERLIVPCTADYASLRGVYNVFYRVFGIADDSGRMTDDDVTTFHTRILETGVHLPKIHTFVLNKSRSHNSNASAAYNAHASEIEKIVALLNKQHKNCFALQRGKRIFNVKDGNTLSAVLNYTGLAPSKLQQKDYSVYEDVAKVNTSQVRAFLEDVHSIVKML